MKRIYQLLTILFIAIVFAGLGSCGNRTQSEQEPIVLEERQVIQQRIEENVYPLPTAAEVIKLLTELDLGYTIGISNPVGNASDYVTSSSRAINMGIYGSDLSYATLYNMQQEVINYLNAIRVLANDLNMSQIYDERLYENIKENFENREELVAILTKSYEETYSFLANNDQEGLALLVVGGAWVEGMYITTHISESVYHVEGIVRVLLDQKKSFELFLDLARPYSDDPLVKGFLDELEPVRKVYEGMSTSLSQKNVEDLTSAIAQVRNQLIR